MATGALDANGIWQYGEDDSETTFSVLLNKLGASASTQIGKRKVLQVVNSQTTTETSTTSSSNINIPGLSATITPSSTSSKILILLNIPVRSANTGGNNFASGELRKNGSLLQYVFAQVGSYGATDLRNNIHTMYLDSPATTSAVTYNFAGNSSLAAIVYYIPSGNPGSITLIEVA